MQTALILIRLFIFRPALFAQKNCKVLLIVGVMIDCFNDKHSDL